MTPEERTLLSDLFRRLREQEGQARDADAEDLIRQTLQTQPAAPYYMAQAVLVQQQALSAAQQRIEGLERQVRDLQPQPRPQSGGSFLGGSRSPWGGGEPPARPSYADSPPPARGPWGSAPPAAVSAGYGQPGYPPAGYPQPGYGQPAFGSGGGGFLMGAAQTAAGVAGGMLAAGAISSMLHHSPGPFGVAETASVSETTINNFYGDGPAGQETGAGLGAPDGARQIDYQPADYQAADYQADAAMADDPGFDAGDGGSDGGDWA